MKPISRHLSTIAFTAILCASLISAAQNPVSTAKTRAMIEGIVVKDPGGEPVKKALIELIAESQADGANHTAVTGLDGTFHIDGIEPGRYRLFAERTGLLETDKRHIRTEGRLLTLAVGQEIKDLQIRLQAAAVVSGRVTDEDGDPMQNAEISLLRKTYGSGRARWEQASSERTNDLGDYRIAGLSAGSYYVSVNPPPDFRNLIEDSGGAGSGERRNQRVPDKPTTTYQTTYYPGTTDRSQAAAIQLHAGDEFPVNFSLAPTPGLSIRGSVVNLPPRASPVIMLQSREFNVIFNGAEMHPDGSFIIRDVSPGAYTIVASVENGAGPMMARQSLQIGANSVEGLRLAPQAGSSIRGRLRLESTRLENSATHFDPTQTVLALLSVDGDDEILPAGEGFSHLARVAPDGRFEWKNVPPGNYYVQLADGNNDAGWFLKSILTGGRDLGSSSLAVEGGSVMLEIVASANGGVIDGVATDKTGEPIGNAVIVAVPEPRLRSRIDRFRKTTTDQSGKFTLRGIPPGDYTVFAWESVDGDSYYDPDFLKLYEPQGTALRVNETDHEALQIEVIPSTDSQP